MREALARLAHDMWIGWMTYLFSKSTRHADGSVTIPPYLVNRWQRLVHTDYADLTDQEKESDREMANRMMEIFGI